VAVRDMAQRRGVLPGSLPGGADHARRAPLRGGLPDGGPLILRAASRTAAVPAGMPLLVKISDVRFRNPVFPGDRVTIEVRKKDLRPGSTPCRAP